MNYFLSKAFKDLKELKEDTFKLDKNGIEDLKHFQIANSKPVETIEIIDSKADNSSELLKDYVGKVILQCTVCDSLIYADARNIKLDALSSVCNTEERCPYCLSDCGYKIIGQVAPLKVEVESDTGEIISDDEEDLNQLTESVNVFDSEQVRPLSQRVRSEILTNNDIPDDIHDNKLEIIDPDEIEELDDGGEEISADINDFDEEAFDGLTEKYLKNIYGNVTSYKTYEARQHKNGLILEGVITFKTNKQKKTTFILECKDVTKKGLVRFTGRNKEITGDHKGYVISGKVSNGNFLTESLNYNYRVKDNEGSKRVYGTVKK